MKAISIEPVDLEKTKGKLEVFYIPDQNQILKAGQSYHIILLKCPSCLGRDIRYLKGKTFCKRCDFEWDNK